MARWELYAMVMVGCSFQPERIRDIENGVDAAPAEDAKVDARMQDDASIARDAVEWGWDGTFTISSELVSTTCREAPTLAYDRLELTNTAILGLGQARYAGGPGLGIVTFANESDTGDLHIAPAVLPTGTLGACDASRADIPLLLCTITVTQDDCESLLVLSGHRLK